MIHRSALDLVKVLLKFTGVPYTEGHNTFDDITELYITKPATADDPQPEDSVILGFDNATGDEVSREFFP